MKVLHVTGENAATGRTGENGGYGDMTPPRSLGRCRSCRSAAAGVTGSQMTGHASSAQIRKGRKKDAALPFFHRLRPPAGIHKQTLFRCICGSLSSTMNPTAVTKPDRT